MHQVQTFVDSNPLNVLVKDMLTKYDGQTEEVNNLPHRHIIGSIQIDTGIYFINMYLKNFVLFRSKYIKIQIITYWQNTSN